MSVEELELAFKAFKIGLEKSNPKKKSDIVLPVKGERNVLITSALPYVNNVPHLGNIVGCVLSADVFARYCRIRGYNTLYVCGTDEYGTATETKALEEKCTPQQICDKYHKIHSDVYKWFDISFDQFGRTTTEKQTEVAQEIFWQLHANGNLIEDDMEQLHCQSCDRFLADRYVEGTCPLPGCGFEDARGDQCDGCGKLINAVELRNPRCKICSATPKTKTSKHIFIDLPKIETRLTEWLDEASKLWTSNARVIAKTWMKNGLQPRCITRDLKWGTKVPKEGFEDKVFYVWFDAPIGYISITAKYTNEWKKWWQNPDLVQHYEFMAKDNVPFHSVVFPATLIGSESKTVKWTMVKHLMATEYLNYEEGKFSKSRGIGVFGNDVATTKIPSDIWRFYLIYTRPENADSSFKWDDLMLKNNSELLANLGNFCNRALKFCKEYFGGKVSEVNFLEKDKEILVEINEHLQRYCDGMENCNQRESIFEVLNISRKGNQLMQAEKPWVSVKSANEEDRNRAASVVSLCANIAALVALLIDPFMPKISNELLKQLNTTLEKVNMLRENPVFKCVLLPGHEIGVPAPLIRDIKKDEIDEMKQRFAGTQKERVQPQKTNKAKSGSKQPKPDPEITKQLEEAIASHEKAIEWMNKNKSSQENISAAKDILNFLKQTQSTGSKNNKGKKK